MSSFAQHSPDIQVEIETHLEVQCKTFHAVNRNRSDLMIDCHFIVVALDALLWYIRCKSHLEGVIIVELRFLEESNLDIFAEHSTHQTITQYII